MLFLWLVFYYRNKTTRSVCFAAKCYIRWSGCETSTTLAIFSPIWNSKFNFFLFFIWFRNKVLTWSKCFVSDWLSAAQTHEQMKWSHHSLGQRSIVGTLKVTIMFVVFWYKIFTMHSHFTFRCQVIIWTTVLGDFDAVGPCCNSSQANCSVTKVEIKINTVSIIKVKVH